MQDGAVHVEAAHVVAQLAFENIHSGVASTPWVGLQRMSAAVFSAHRGPMETGGPKVSETPTHVAT